MQHVKREGKITSYEIFAKKPAEENILVSRTPRPLNWRRGAAKMKEENR